jgi:hypothetical protein
MHTIHRFATPHPRRLLGGIALAAGLALAGCGGSRPQVAGPTTDAPGTTTNDTTTTALGGDPPDSEPEPADEAEDAADVADDSVGFPDGGGGGFDPGDGGSGEGGELEPWGDEPEPAGPCAAVLSTGATLLVAPDPAILPSGTMSSALSITNCGDEAIDWTANTIPDVALANGAGNLAAGSTSELGFTIDSAAFEPGAVEFKIKVSEPGHNHYVDVHAFRELVGSDLVGSLDLSAGEGSGGCANQCITAGHVTGNATTSNVTMEVATNTPAVITVWLSTQAPSEEDGHPVFPGFAPYGNSGQPTTSWSTTLEPLAPETKYHLIVAATDEFEHTSYRTGSFRTFGAIDLPADVGSPDGPGGCSAECITTALVTPGFDRAGLHVEVHTSAAIDVWVSTNEPDDSGDTPTFGEDVDKAATTDGLDLMQWDAEITGLQPDTRYHIIVRARDLYGHESFAVGSFLTAEAPRIMARFRSVAIVEDGDDSALWNPGELSFRWGFDEFTIGSRGEEKIGLNNAFLLPDDPARTAFVFEDDGGPIPTMHISAAERDPDGLSEFCPMGEGVLLGTGYLKGCDVKWTSASSDPTMTTADFDDLPRCSQFELEDSADLPCLVLSSIDAGSGDYPLFWAVVSFEVLDS